MKYFFLLLLIFTCLLSEKTLTAQVSMGFENRTTTQNSTSVSDQYRDLGSAFVAHVLEDYIADGITVPVSSPTSPSVLGFTTSFRPSRSGAPTSTEGLTEGDIFGYAGGTAASSVGAPPTEGSNVFFVEDTDGEVTLTFAPVDLNMTPAVFTMDFIVDGTFEFDNGANDRLYIRMEVTGCPAATTIDLFDSDGGGSGGGGGNDLNLAIVNGAEIVNQNWNTLTQDLAPYAACIVQLVIEADLNSSTEEMAFDNINFTSGMALPVEFIEFSGYQQKNAALLSWSTTQETENSGFSVERSMDGQHFTEIGWVNGAGESNSRKDYSHKDSDVRPGNGYYYRLRQVDFDGAFAYSELVYVYIDGEGAPGRNDHFYPNPAVAGKSQLDLTVSSESDWVMTVFDAAGRSVLENQYRLVAGRNTIDLDLAAQNDGAYLVRIVGPDETIVRRVVR